MAVTNILVVAFMMVHLARGEMTEEARTQLLTLHNEHRASLGASNMFQMQWDEQLAQRAEEWNNRCEYRRFGRGQNIAWYRPSSPLSTREYIEKAFNDWYDQRNQHVYGSGRCYPTSSCYYSQLAWHDTTRMGCSYRMCNSDNDGADTWWMVCLYSPWGNNEGERMFEMGNPCSHSDCNGLQCENNLCVGEPFRNGDGNYEDFDNQMGYYFGNRFMNNEGRYRYEENVVDRYENNYGDRYWDNFGERYGDNYDGDRYWNNFGDNFEDYYDGNFANRFGGRFGYYFGNRYGDRFGDNYYWNYGCRDRDEFRCQEMASNGECRRNPFMFSQCRRACGFC